MGKHEEALDNYCDAAAELEACERSGGFGSVWKEFGFV